MNQPRIPVRPSSWIRFPSRRDLLRGLASAGLALPFMRPPDSAARKKHKRKRKKKAKRNAFGCVNVGQFCKNAGQCCSGFCQGKQGKKRCQAHDSGGCQVGQDLCGGAITPCTTGTGDAGFCVRTTGNAGYCSLGGRCTTPACQKDADCHELCGPHAACIVCEGDCHSGPTVCVGPSEGSCIQA